MIKSALGCYDDILTRDSRGVRPIWRSREWMEGENVSESESRNVEWYVRPSSRVEGQGPKFTAPLILDPTPGGQLEKDLKQVCIQFAAASQIEVSVHLRGGAKLSREVKSEPVGSRECDREKCETCNNPETRGGGCQRHSTGYQYQCEACKAVGITALYYGETSKSIFCRQSQHSADIAKLRPENAMAKHCLVQHDGVRVKFSIEAAGTHRTPMSRQINEAVRISRSKVDIILNSKAEFRQAALIRVVPTFGLITEQQTYTRPMRNPGSHGS